MSGRSLGEVWKTVWLNFKQSFNRGHASDIFVGKDQHGNRYFEKIADQSRDHRHQRRVETPCDDPTVVPELPVEWIAWLRGRRAHPPTEEEIASNAASSKEILARAQELEQEENRALNRPSAKSTFKTAAASKFPIYTDYDAEGDDSRDKTK